MLIMIRCMLGMDVKQYDHGSIFDIFSGRYQLVIEM